MTTPNPRAGTHPRQSEITHVTAAGRSTTQLSQVAVERFDDYAIVAKIGQGGMAEVFLALEQGPGAFRKLLVVKRLFSHLGEDPHVVDMFMREATLAARLHHPNIVQTNKVSVCDGQHFMAMEYLEGQPLHRVLSRLRSQGEVMASALAAHVVAEVLEGLAYAHELCDYDGTPLEVVHRDISPHNVFLTYDGQVKLLDFGIAKAALAESNTRTGLIKGKFSYIAPEQARGEAVDARADLWSMGVTLWECLAGDRPFKGANEVAVLRSVLTEELPELTEVAPQVPAELSRILRAALARDRTQRVADARSFRRELTGFLRSAGTETSRADVATLMRSLFGDKLEERRETVRRCVAQVERLSSIPPPLPRVLATTPAPDDVPVRRRPLVLAALCLIGVGIAAAFALRGDEAPVLAALPTATAPSQPSQAPVLPTPALAAATQAAEPVSKADPLPAAQARAPRPVKHPRPSPPRSAPVQPAVVADPPAKEKEQVAPGTLVLDASPYAVVMLGDKKLGITPLEVELPAATHTLVLRNPERGIETTYRITIPSGERITRRIALE